MRQKAARMGVESEAVGGTSVSFRYWASMLNSEDGVVPMPSRQQARCVGVHSVQLIGAPTRGNELAFFTAWSGWAKGDGVIGVLSREYLDGHATSYIADRPWNVGPLGETTDACLGLKSSSEFRDLWSRARPCLQIRMKGSLKLEIYEGWSYGYACPAHLYIIFLKPAATLGSEGGVMPGPPSLWQVQPRHSPIHERDRRSVRLATVPPTALRARSGKDGISAGANPWRRF